MVLYWSQSVLCLEAPMFRDSTYSLPAVLPLGSSRRCWGVPRLCTGLSTRGNVVSTTYTPHRGHTHQWREWVWCEKSYCVFILIVGVTDGGSHGNSGDVEWEQVGPKNKSAITREVCVCHMWVCVMWPPPLLQTTFQTSPITKLFGGELRSSVHRHKAKESATLQPFFSLQLDIQVIDYVTLYNVIWPHTHTQSEDVWTVEDALKALAAKETVHMSEVRHLLHQLCCVTLN